MTRKERAMTLRMQPAAADGAGGGRPVPEWVRRAAVDYAAEATAKGESPDEVSQEFGIRAMSIQHWAERAGRGVAEGEPLRRGEIVADLGTPTLPAMIPAVVVPAPAGLRIEGLRVKDLAALVRAIG